jgi:signal transduction histidine kinase/ActR/RegA family two-component response regulator
MLTLLQNIFLPKSFFEGSPLERRRSMLMHKLILFGLCAFGFYFVYFPDYDHTVNLIGMAGYWGLLALLLIGAPYLWVAHATFLWSILYVGYMAAWTGGINSPAMVWMTALVLPAILLLERVPAFIWVGIVFAANLFLFLISKLGVVSSDINMANEVMLWAIMSKLFVIAFALFVGLIAQHMHRNQVAEMERSNEELEKTHQELLRAQAHKDEFIASVGHELRTPMNAILGLNGILSSELATRPDDAQVVDHIRRSTEQLLQVVNDILDFSQLQAGRLTLHDDEFALRETLLDVMSAFEVKVHAKVIQLNLDVAAGQITLRAQVVGAGVMFEVEDTGIGIAADRQKQIFHGFEHADVQTNRQYGGTGLGLSICERLVTLQGGIIGVNSVQGQGSRFWFVLPLRRIAMHDAKVAAEMARTLVDQVLQILLVDDNAVNLLVARMMLKKCFPQATIVEASNGPDALVALRKQYFDLVLMDMVMPDMDGLQVTQAIRQTLPAPVCNMPVLALTASSNPVDHDRCLAAGMDDVLHKPLDEQQLIVKISTVLAAHKQRSQT